MHNTTLKVYDFKDPRTGVVEEVYNYPADLATGFVTVSKDCTLVSREPLKFPAIIVPNEYLTERTNQRITTSGTCVIHELWYYWLEQRHK